jgi:serine phosphatase RsbU (regulator of sigma subunit)
LPQAAYQKGDTSLNPGDLLVLFSDGVVEAANAKGLEFGQEGIEKVIRDHADLPPNELKQEILGQLATFMGSEALQDDMTLLIVRVPPNEA